LGRGIALRLQAEGHDAKAFDEFAGRPDVEFLPIIGERQWVLITKDKNVRRNQLEVEAILNSDVRAFVVTAANLNHEQIAQLVLKAMPKITRISRQQGPLCLQHHGQWHRVPDSSPHPPTPGKARWR